MNRLSAAGFWAALVLLAAGAAGAVGPQLRVERVDGSQYPIMRAYVSLLGSNGTPITGLGKENFKVVELKTREVAPLSVQSLDAAGYGMSVALVVQSSGVMSPVLDDIRKAVAGFANSLGDHDQAALIIYSDKVETLAPMGEKTAVASAAARLDNPGFQRLFFDGVASAFSLFTAPALPAARAIVIFGDGGDSGSAADLERIVADAKRRKIPIYAVGHSQTGGRDLETLSDLATRTFGLYDEAIGPEDFNRSFGRVLQTLSKQYVVEWKAKSIKSDAQTYPLEVVVEVGETRLRGAGEVTTPEIKSYTTLIVVLVSILLLAGIGVVVYVKTRPEPPPERICPACNRQQMPEWEVCLFCLKVAQAKLHVTKGPNNGKVYPLVGKVVQIGKGPENAVRLMDPSVSTAHCGIQIDGSKFEIVDVGSKNGTYVNGRKVQRRFLRNGDVLTLGQSELRFESSVSDSDLGDYG